VNAPSFQDDLITLDSRWIVLARHIARSGYCSFLASFNPVSYQPVLWRANRNLAAPDVRLLLDFFALNRPVGTEQLDRLLGDSWLVLISSGVAVVATDGRAIIPGVILVVSHGLLLFVDQPNQDPTVYFGDDTLGLLTRLVPVGCESSLDLCSGSGVQALFSSLFVKRSVAVEINPETRGTLSTNIQLNGLSDRIEVKGGSLFAQLEDSERFDFITANPPLVPFPDQIAYPFVGHGGNDGLSVTRRIIAGLPERLQPWGAAEIIGLCFGSLGRAVIADELTTLSKQLGLETLFTILSARVLSEKDISSLTATALPTSAVKKEVVEAKLRDLIEASAATHLMAFCLSIRIGSGSLAIQNLSRIIVEVSGTLCSDRYLLDHIRIDSDRKLEEATIEPLMASGSIEKTAFDDSFLQHTAFEQVVLVVEKTLNNLGALCCVTRMPGGAYRASFERGEAKVWISLQGGRVSKLSIERPMVHANTLEEACNVLNSRPGTVAYLVLLNGEEVVQQNADVVLPTASSSKLAILNALLDAYSSNALERSTTVRLSGKHKSQATGILQTWPEGVELTVESLAMLMMSLSDNSAADVLLEAVGSTLMSPYVKTNRPYLTTRQITLLRADENKTLADVWLQCITEEDRSAVLHQVDELHVESDNLLKVTNSPSALLIKSTEWFYSVRQLCKFISRVAEHPAFQINLGQAAGQRWDKVAYKGGLESNIINATYDLVSRDGNHFTLSATWNCEEPNFAPDLFFDDISRLLSSLPETTNHVEPRCSVRT